MRICLDGGAKIDPVLRPGALGVLELPPAGLAGGVERREGLIPPGTGPEVSRSGGATKSYCHICGLYP